MSPLRITDAETGAGQATLESAIGTMKGSGGCPGGRTLQLTERQQLLVRGLPLLAGGGACAGLVLVEAALTQWALHRDLLGFTVALCSTGAGVAAFFGQHLSARPWGAASVALLTSIIAATAFAAGLPAGGLLWPSRLVALGAFLVSVTVLAGVAAELFLTRAFAGRGWHGLGLVRRTIIRSVVSAAVLLVLLGGAWGVLLFTFLEAWREARTPEMVLSMAALILPAAAFCLIGVYPAIHVALEVNSPLVRSGDCTVGKATGDAE